MLNRLLAILTTLVTATWFGGLLMLFVAVSSLFERNERATAGKMASDVFSGFEGCQLFVAAALLICLMCWLSSQRERLKVLMLFLAAVATAIALYNTVSLSPALDRMRLSGQTATQQFRSMHGMSMALYFTQTLLVGAIAALLPSTITRDARHGHVDQRTLTI